MSDFVCVVDRRKRWEQRSLLEERKRSLPGHQRSPSKWRWAQYQLL